MLSIKDLADALGLSPSQVRRRLTAFDGVIDDYCKRGKKSKILVNSSGLELLKRLETLCKEGLTIEEAAKEIEDEIGNNDSANHREVNDNEELLKAQINQLQSEVRYLRKKLDEKDQQIRQLLPAPNNKGSIQDKSLWQVIREWFKQPATN